MPGTEGQSGPARTGSLRTVRLLAAALLVAVVGYAVVATGRARTRQPERIVTQNGVAYADDENRGPLRIAYVSYLDGQCNWRPDGSASWSRAAMNLPLRQGAEIQVPYGSRAVVTFDDGSRLYMARDAVVSLHTLYSDSDGEFTQLTLRTGSIALRPRERYGVFQVDTPYASCDASGPGLFRIDALRGLGVRTYEGRCTIDGRRGKRLLDPGQYLELAGYDDPYDIAALPPNDAFDVWVLGIIPREARYHRSPYRRYLPDNIAIVADDLDDYGTWRDDRRYGHVWCPRDVDEDWRPYHDGRWTWCQPYGWTWVSDEPWGWAPYHYGTWVHEDYGWGWVPGPRTQCWSPAVVSFSYYDDDVCWAPLAPYEVRYPSTLSIGFSSGDWSLFFSAPAAGVYYPTHYGYCVSRPWSTGYVNNVTYINTVTNYNTYVSDPGFIPYNARYAPGACMARLSAFGGTGDYVALPADPQPYFRHGHLVSQPAGDYLPVAGPPSVPPDPAAWSPTRRLLAEDPVSPNVFSQPVYSAPNPVQERLARRFGRDSRFASNQTPAGPIQSSRFGRTPFGGAPSPAPFAGAPGNASPDQRFAGAQSGRFGRVPPTAPQSGAGSEAPFAGGRGRFMGSQGSPIMAASPERQAAMRARETLGLRRQFAQANTGGAGAFGSQPGLGRRNRVSAGPGAQAGGSRFDRTMVASAASPEQRAAMHARQMLGMSPGGRGFRQRAGQQIALNGGGQGGTSQVGGFRNPGVSAADTFRGRRSGAQAAGGAGQGFQPGQRRFGGGQAAAAFSSNQGARRQRTAFAPQRTQASSGQLSAQVVRRGRQAGGFAQAPRREASATGQLRPRAGQGLTSSPRRASAPTRQFTPRQYTPRRQAPTRQYTPQRYTAQQAPTRRYTPRQYTPRQFSPRSYTPERYTPRQYTPRRYTQSQPRAERQTRQFAPQERAQTRFGRQRQFSAPERRYSPPQRSYTAPERRVSRQERQYSPPRRSYSPPQRSFSQPERRFFRQERQFSAPQRSYSPPQQRSYPPPEQRGFARQERRFSAPERQYSPPQRSYSPPQERRFSPPPEQRQAPPERHFFSPPPERQAPQQRQAPPERQAPPQRQAPPERRAQQDQQPAGGDQQPSGRGWGHGHGR